MKNAVQVMISSPADVMEECKVIKETLKNFSDENGTYSFVANTWKDNAPVDSRNPAQKQINNTILEEADIVIAVFGLKLGSPTENYESGTVEEIERHIAKGKYTCIYFIKKDISSFDMTSDLIQDIKKIMDFKTKIKKNKFYAEIDNLETLKSRVRKDLQYYINELNKKEIEKSTEQVIFAENFDNTIKQSYQSDLGIYSEVFITDIINEEIKKENIKGEYKGNLTFYENIQLLKDKDQMFIESTFIEIMQRARRIAFNKKYSDYDYNKNDARTLCDWKKIIKDRLENLLNNSCSNKNILGIGSNDGSELLDIFENQENKYTVVDISDLAIKKGETKFPNISFKQGDMESLNRLVDKESFDICLCLRSIQSRGVFRNNAIIQMMKTLKQGGVLMISIPNGYLDKEQKFKKGLYDYRIKSIVQDRPITLIQKIYKKLTDLHFNNVGVQSIDSEILVWGIK